MTHALADANVSTLETPLVTAEARELSLRLGLSRYVPLVAGIIRRQFPGVGPVVVEACRSRDSEHSWLAFRFTAPGDIDVLLSQNDAALDDLLDAVPWPASDSIVLRFDAA